MTLDITTKFSKDHDALILLSGDDLFIPVVESIKQQGKMVILICEPFMTSLKLADLADEIVRLDEIFPKIIPPEEYSKESATSEKEELTEEFFLKKGHYFDPYRVVRALLRRSKESVTIIDTYIDGEILSLLSSLNKEIKCSIITKIIKEPDFDVMVNKLRKEGRRIDYIKSENFHDRFIRVDDVWWQVGHSIKDLGKANARMSKVVDAGIIRDLFEQESAILGSAKRAA